MLINAYRKRYRKAFSLIEIMLAVAVLSVAVIGMSTSRYYSALDTKTADLYITSARLSLILSESWKGYNKGAADYDPVVLLSPDLNIIEFDEGPDEPEDFTILGTYKVTLDNTVCYATLSYDDSDNDIRKLNIIVAWPRKPSTEAELDDAEESFILTTYVQK